MENAYATRLEVDEANVLLHTAMEWAQLYNEAEQIDEELSRLDSADYTAESWDRLQKARADAAELLQKADAGAEELKAARTVL